MKYEPVKILDLFMVVTDLKTGRQWRRRNFFQVRSKQFGTCGHRHRTRSAAQPCLERMQRQWHHWRSKVSQRGAKGEER